MTVSPQNRRAVRNVAVLAMAQAILGSQLPMAVIIGGLVGQQLAPNPCLATLPISMMVLGSALTAPWMSELMQRRGRRAGFVCGALGGFAGALLSVLAVQSASFGLLLGGSLLTGIYMSAQGFYRFAAADTASDAFRPKAISYVLAGGLVAALLGPQLVALLSGESPVATADRFLPVYAAAMVLNLAGLGLFFFIDIPKPAPAAPGAANGRTRLQLLGTPAIAVAIICAAVSYALMTLVMTSSPMAVVGCGFGVVDASHVVSGHVFAMYIPSFFTGHLIARFGIRPVIAAGLALLTLSGGVALSGVALTNFFAALILLGLGWNFGFIGATTMLTSLVEPAEKGRAQGLNDAIVFAAVTVASFASGGLMNCTGASAEAGWNAVNLAMFPLLVLAGAALIWLSLHPRAAGQRT